MAEDFDEIFRFFSKCVSSLNEGILTYHHYQIPMTCCISRLTTVMLAQQQAPKSSGFPPLFTSLMRLLFKPMAAIAMIIKNLLSSLSG